ncbi:hypothetical protein GCM10022265_06340 [Marinobacter xestospongiae]
MEKSRPQEAGKLTRLLQITHGIVAFDQSKEIAIQRLGMANPRGPADVKPGLSFNLAKKSCCGSGRRVRPGSGPERAVPGADKAADLQRELSGPA